MEWNIEVTLPVMRDMTIVAEVRRPEMTAREEVWTEIGGMEEEDAISGGVGDGVG